MSPARLIYEQVRVKASGMGNEGTEEVEEERRRQKNKFKMTFVGCAVRHLI